MNPDACRDVMDRSRIPYENGASDVGKVTSGLDELSLRKQLPLRQQTSKPVLKYNTSMTKAVHLFSQGDVNLNRKDLSGINSYAQNGMYYTGHVPSNPISKTETKTTSKPLTSQPNSINHEQSIRRNSTTSNPYIRPVSASEIAANINSEKAKRMLASAAAVSNLPEKSDAVYQSQILQRNSFLRPLSGVSVNKEKQATAKQGNTASSIKPNQSGSSILQRRNSAGSDSSGRHYGDNKAAKQTMFHFASTTSTSIKDGKINKHIFIAHESIAPSSSSSSVPPTSLGQNALGSVRPPLGNHAYSAVQPGVEKQDTLIKQAISYSEPVPSSSSSSSYFHASYQPKSVAINTASSNYANCEKNADLGVSGSYVSIRDTETVSLKKMPVTNTLTGTVYYRKASLSDSLTKTRAIDDVEVNINTSNRPGRCIQEQLVEKQTQPILQTVSNDETTNHLQSKPPPSRPPFERSNASAQLTMKPSTQETKTNLKTKTSMNKTPPSGSASQNLKPLTDGTVSQSVKSLTKSVSSSIDISDKDQAQAVTDRSLPEKSKRKPTVTTKSSTTKLSNGANEKKMSPMVNTSSLTKTEQRLMGDGAPSKFRTVPETSLNTSPKKSKWNNDSAEEDENSYDDETGDAEDSNDDEYDNDEYDERGSDSIPPGERLPGDGEASDEDFDDEDGGMEYYEDDVTDDGGSDSCSIQSSTSGQSARPMTAQSAQPHKSASLDLEDRVKPLRPLTAACAAVVKPAFRLSLFPRVPPTLNFVSEGEKTETLPWEIRKLLKWKMSPITPIVVKTALARVGFRITKRNHDWLGCFGKHMKSQCFKSLREYQKINHFPGSFQIGRKDKLWRSLSKMQVHFGKREFNFFPHTYVLPCDMKLLKRAWDEGGSKQKWIIKPPASARGIGIRVISKWTQIPRRRPVIVQKYIHRPFLINSSKFDMRVYVYVSSYDPLRLYMYEDGLARFASCKYSSSMKSLGNRYMHLTNYSVNKKNSEYLSNSDNTQCQGHKWSLKALWNYLKRQGINTTLIWDTIRDLVIKTIISGDSMINSMTKANCRSRYSCHELFGFDILLDENLKPWILEVNISPSLHSNSQLDISIKGGMIKDMMNIAGFRVPDERDVTSSPSTSDFSTHSPLNKYCMDKRLFTNQLSPDERAKHAYFCQRYQDEQNYFSCLRASAGYGQASVVEIVIEKRHVQIMQSILDTITPDDMRHLCESIDEDSRKGNFQRLFPTPHTHRYLKYFEQPRYYNLLLDQWVLRYNRMEQRGIMLLQSFCEDGLHLQNPTMNPRHQWTPPNSTLASMRGADIRPLGPQNSARGSGTIAPIPRMLKKLPSKPGQLSQSSSNNSLSSLVTANSPQLHTPTPIGPIASPSR